MNKIYEFKYIDKLNLSSPELLKRVESILVSEAEFQGWQSGYTFRHSCVEESPKMPEERIYIFEVFGHFIDQIDNKHDDNFEDGKEVESFSRVAEESTL